MIKIEFPSDRKDIASAIGQALLEIGGCAVLASGEVVSAIDESLTRDFSEHEDFVETAAPETAAPSADGVMLDESAQAAESATAVDLKGVAFNGEFCGKAKDQFYASGPRKGQWKKRKGVDDTAYDTWYASQAITVAASAEPEIVDTSGAFNTQQPAAAFPTEAGPFMAWVAEMQTGGHFSQADVNEAYATAGVSVNDLFSDNAAAAIQSVGQLLTAKVQQ